MLVCRACGTLALDQQCSLAGRCANGQLIESQDLTTMSQNATTSLLSDTQSANLDLGYVQDTRVVSDCTNDNGNRVRASACLQETANTLQRHWSLIRTAHEQSTQDDLVKLLERTSVQETVQL